MSPFIAPLIALLVVSCSGSGCSHTSRPPEDAVVIRDDLVAVPAGWFSSGCYRIPDRPLPSKYRDLTTWDNSEYARAVDCVNDDPPRRLWISSFEIDRFEVTNADYAQCLDARRCKQSQSKSSWMTADGRDFPAEFPAVVTFDDAEAFCAWRSKRLPTAAEWQKAARGTDERMFPWGDSIPDWCQWDQPRVSSLLGLDDLELFCQQPQGPVGRRPQERSPYGVEDMLGGAEQWVTDWAFWPSGDRDTGDPRFSIEEHGNVASIALDWSSIKFKWLNSAIVDPTGPPREGPSYKWLNPPGADHVVSMAPVATQHLVRNSHTYRGSYGGMIGAELAMHSEATPNGRVRYAAFRCVRSVPGPTPPKIVVQPAEVAVLPFREPGYTPPGTPATPAKKGKGP